MNKRVYHKFHSHTYQGWRVAAVRLQMSKGHCWWIIKIPWCLRKDFETNTSETFLDILRPPSPAYRQLVWYKFCEAGRTDRERQERPQISDKNLTDNHLWRSAFEIFTMFLIIFWYEVSTVVSGFYLYFYQDMQSSIAPSNIAQTLC